MFGDEDIDRMVEAMEDYEYYGKPWLAIVCELLGIDWTEFDDEIWGNDELDMEYLDLEERKAIIEEYKAKIPFEKIKEKFEKFVGGG